LIIGSGPIVIGQAAEFDYAGTQACIALKEEGYNVILVNSNPATIMTDAMIADKVYMEPLTIEYVTNILRHERPDAIVPGIGGQTGLNMAMQLEREGILKEYCVELLGTSSTSIARAEDRELFKELCQSLGEPIIPSRITYSLEEAQEAAQAIGYPVVLRPAFTLGGTGGGFADNEKELVEICYNAFKLSPIHQVLVEKSVKGYREIEFEVMRDATDRVITICGMENIDPVGVHTGDSIVVAPIMTLNKHDLKMLNDSAIKIIRELKIEGGCNIQFALNTHSDEYYIIEVNPRVSRSSALASKASGYPIARVTAKIAVGMTLDEIDIAGVTATIEPKLDYFVVKFPRFPFDKFPMASNILGTQMKATGEVMAIGSNIEECILKSVRSLEIGVCHLRLHKFDDMPTNNILTYIFESHDDNIFGITELIRRNVSIDRLFEITQIMPPFLEAIKRIVDKEKELKMHVRDYNALYSAKVMGFCDKYIAELWNMSETAVYKLRKEKRILPVFRMVNALCKDKYTPYLYSSYTGNNDARITNKKKIVVLGSGPIRIGQGIEFDYSTVHAINIIKNAGYEAIIINNNPETVSTDYTMSDKLYFEPLTYEDVMNIIDLEQPEGVIVSLGGQTAINLAESLNKRGVNIVGTDYNAIENAENRDCFEKTLQTLNIPHPEGYSVTNVKDGIKVARRIGYPILVRPSFVLGGRAMQLVANKKQLEICLKTAVAIDEEKPVLIDKYIGGKEIEVDAICDGEDVFIPGVMELIERTGIHSGDSISVFPTFSISDKVKKTILQYTGKIGISMGIKGLFNIQFIVDPDDKVYIIEVNPRSSRTVPFISKSTGYNLADIATNVILGKTLKEQGIFDLCPLNKKIWYVKVPVFSFNKIKGLDAYLSPEMKSTGEAFGHDESFYGALYKAFRASGLKMQNYGTVYVKFAKRILEEAVPLIRRFCNFGFGIVANETTAKFFQKHGICSDMLQKSNCDDIYEALRAGEITYVINICGIDSKGESSDYNLRRFAAENNVPVFTSLETVKSLIYALDYAFNF